MHTQFVHFLSHYRLLQSPLVFMILSKSFPVDGAWSQWITPPSRCAGTCGMDAKRRTCTNPAPAHGGQNCPGEALAALECPQLPDCPHLSECLFKAIAGTCWGHQRIHFMIRMKSINGIGKHMQFNVGRHGSVIKSAACYYNSFL